MVCHIVWIDLRRKGLRWNLPEGGGNHTGASVDFPLLSLVTGHLWWDHRYRPQWSCSPALMVFLVSNTFSFGTCAQYGEQHGAGFAPGWCWATCFAAVLLRRTKKSCRAWAKGSCLKLDLVKTEVFLWWFEKWSVAAEVMAVLLAWDSILTPRPWVWTRTCVPWGERVRQHMVLREKTGNDSTISFLSGRILHLKTLNNCGVSKTWQTGLLICLGNDA